MLIVSTLESVFIICYSISQVREGVLPLFLEDCLLPLFRAGQQLQIITKLLEFCDSFGPFNGIHEELLPGIINGFASEFPSFRSSLLFEKGTIETMVVSRNSYYQRMLEKVDNVFTKLEFRFREVIFQRPLFQYHLSYISFAFLYSCRICDFFFLSRITRCVESWLIACAGLSIRNYDFCMIVYPVKESLI